MTTPPIDRADAINRIAYLAAVTADAAKRSFTQVANDPGHIHIVLSRTEENAKEIEDLAVWLTNTADVVEVLA